MWAILVQAASGATTSTLGQVGSFGNFETQVLPGFFKILFVTSAFLYLVFAFVTTRQIKVMRSTLITPFSPVVRLVGYAHLALALLVFISFVLFL